MSKTYSNISIILPAKNESASLTTLLPNLQNAFPSVELIVVNDGSTDTTVEVCEQLGVKLISHRYSKGNGAAIKSGARNATGEIMVFMDADGQHTAANVKILIDAMADDVDMVVGSRDAVSHAGVMRKWANGFYNRLSSWITGHQIDDLTSGFRAVRRDKFRQFLFLLPNGFSYPTTITMAFFKMGYTVIYQPVDVKKRTGKSHIKPILDGVRFLLIIFKIGTLYSPLKLFFPASLMFFALGLANYAYTFINYQTFTNMSGVMLTSSVIVFLMGLAAEQLTMLIYSKIDS